MSELQCGLTGWLGPLRHQVSLLYVHDVITTPKTDSGKTESVDESVGDRQFIVTGSKSGHLWLWDIAPSSSPSSPSSPSSSPTPLSSKGSQLTPRMLLLGHKSPVRAVVYCRVALKSAAAPFNHAIITASEDGEVMMWNVEDGRCLKANPKAFNGVPTNLQLTPDGEHVICSGTSSEIRLIDTTTLEVVQTLQHHDNWVNFAVVHQLEKGKDILFSVTFEGALRAWSFEDMIRSRDTLPLRYILQEIHEAHFLEVSKFNSELIMVLTTQDCLLFSSGNFTKLLAIPCPDDTRWVGGTFIEQNILLLWTTNERGFLYKLPKFASATNFSLRSSLAHPTERKETSQDTEETILLSTFAKTEGSSARSSHTSVMGYFPPKANDAAGEHTLVCFGTRGSATILTQWTFERSLLTGSASLSPMIYPTSELTIDDFQFAQEKIEWRPNNSIPTAVSLVRERWLVQGFQDGGIRIAPMDSFSMQSKNIRFFKGHTDRVTCLMAPEISKQYLLSGSADFTVKVWNMDTGELLYTFLNHTGEIISFVSPPPEAGPRMKGCVCTVGKDKSLSIISLEDMKTLYLFAGHPFPISHLYWRVRDDHLCVACSDGTVYIWQMATGHLDRRVTGQAAADILTSCDCQIRISQDIASQLTNTNRALQCYSLTSDLKSNDMQATILMFDVKKMIIDFHEKVASFSSPKTEESTPDQQTDSSSTLGKKSSILGKKPSLLGKKTSVVSVSTIDDERLRQKLEAEKDKPEDAAVMWESVESTTEFALMRALLSILASWGVDPVIDQLCEEKLGMRRFPPHVTLTIAGANGNLAIHAPGRHGSRNEWDVSPFITAVRLLCLMALVKCIFAVKGVEDDIIRIITHYCTLLPEKVDHFKEPALATLAKFWQDPAVDIQQSARSLILASLARMSKERKTEVIEYWSSFLPYGNVPKKSKNISVVILGVFGADHSDFLNPATRQKIARSLISIMSDETLGIIRVSAVDLLGKGYSCWRGITNDLAILKLLFGLAYPKKTLVTPVSAALVKSAKQSMVLIAECVPATFVSVITTDFLISKVVQDKIGALRILSLVIKKRPQVLSLHIPKIVQSVVDLLDPNVPHMRESLLQPTTTTLHDLVTTYPSITFHGVTQRLAVGTSDGCVIVYDLKTATKWQVLEGHFGPVSAVSFSKDGNHLLSFSAVDSLVRVWQTSQTSFFGILGNSTRCLKQIKVPPSGKTPTNANETARFEWLSPKLIVLYNGQGEPFNFTL